MKTISTREFQLHLKDYIDGAEDLTLTKRDKVVGYFLHELPTDKNEPTGTMPVENEIPDMSDIVEVEGDLLWEDYNMMPVYKIGIDDQFCTNFHKAGLRQRVYPIKKFRADGSLELEGNYCIKCIKGFLEHDGHLE